MKVLLIASVFITILLSHFFFTTGSQSSTATGGWAVYQFDAPAEPRLDLYFAPGLYWLGLSYAISGAFAVWCFSMLLAMRRAAIGGLTFSAAMWAGLCFLTGCCGSPMLPLYLGLFGPKFIDMTRPLVFVFTLVSILVGYAWMLKYSRKEKDDHVDTGLHETIGANS